MKKVLLWLAGALVVLLLAGFLLPRYITGSASTEIRASPHALTLLTSSMRQFNRWSPWKDIDPRTNYVFSGPYAGPGSKLAWSSAHHDVGKGEQTITAVAPGKSVDVALLFDGSEAMTSRFSFEPLTSSTQTSWSFRFDAGNNPLMRWMGLVFKSRGLKDYEKGLAKLKALAEAAPEIALDGFDAQVVDMPAATLASIAHDAPLVATAVAPALKRDFAAILTAVKKQGLTVQGPPRAAFVPVGEPGKPDSRYRMTTLMPVDAAFKATGSIARVDAAAGPALQIIYHGDYESMGPSYIKGEAMLRLLGLAPAGDYFEIFVDDPTGKDPASVRTDIIMPVKY